MRWKRPLAATVTLGLALVTGISVASAGDTTSYKVKKLKYHNNGAYEACVDLRWINPGDPNTVHKLSHDVTSQLKCIDNPSSTTTDLTNLGTDSKPKQGAEVWAVINITYGDNKSCRKDGQKFYFYNESDAGTARYKTSGYTKNDNHCKVMGCDDCAVIDATTAQ